MRILVMGTGGLGGYFGGLLQRAGDDVVFIARRAHLRALQAQVLLLVLLTVIAVELGLVVIKLPTPIARAGPSAPAPGLQDPHDVLRAQLEFMESKSQ